MSTMICCIDASVSVGQFKQQSVQAANIGARVFQLFTTGQGGLVEQNGRQLPEALFALLGFESLDILPIFARSIFVFHFEVAGDPKPPPFQFRFVPT